MKIKAPLLVFLVSVFAASFAQPTCSSDPLTISSSMNFSDIVWKSSGSGVCPPGANFTGNITIHLASGVTVTMDEDITISGNFKITNNGSSMLVIPGGVTVHVLGNMGDGSNNNVTYHVDGELIVDGTLVGNNDNVFEGSGSISGGTLDVKNNSSCGTPCPVYGGFDNCNYGNAPALCVAALPVKLLYFDARVVDTSIELKWATSMEKNFYKFVIQRSADGLAFEEIGEVEGHGFDIYDIESKYSFVDEAPLIGFNYYRLKAVDLDDSFEYFGVKAVNISAPRKMTIYPNPTTGNEISFRVNFGPQESDRIILTDQLGSEVYNSPVASSTNTFALKNELRPGMYVLRYISKNFEQVSRVVIKN